MYYKWLLLLVFLIIFICKLKKKENFDNCSDCNEYYSNRLQDIQQINLRQLIGYHPNDYIYKMFLIDSDKPLPVNANYWFHKY